MTEATFKKAPRVILEPDLNKIVESILYVINEARQCGYILTQYDILKTLFIADKTHLNKYGRPVTYDNYCAMRAGPVPSTTYDLLKESAGVLNKLRRVGIRSLPWKRSSRGPDGRYYYEAPKPSAPNEEILSPSDLSALRSALNIVKSLPFIELRKMLHSDEAYLEAWEADSTRKSFPMSYGMLFDAPNFEAAERVKFLSKSRY